MTESEKKTTAPTRPGEQVVRVVVETTKSSGKSWATRILFVVLLLSVMLNFALFSAYGTYFNEFDGPTESYHSGDKLAEKKVALIRVSGTIMPPFTEGILEKIEHAQDDPDVVGMVLAVDSPGGLVADSHQIYHRLQEFAESKPIFVQMQRIAASGGYYIAMGQGKTGRIYAEPTTWTGSIGVIIPHYNMTELADKVGVQSEPLKTGEFKDSLSSFKPISERDREVWDAILDEAFQQFLAVIEIGRPDMTRENIESIATGQVFTANQALANGMVDRIGFLEDAIADLQNELNIGDIRVIEYEDPPTFTDILLGSVKAPNELSLLTDLLQSPSPRAFYMLGNP